MEIVTPFESATHCVQGDRVVPGSMVVPVVRILKAEMALLCDKFTTNFVTALKDSVDKRLSHYEQYDAFLTAAALDPWFKLQWCTVAEKVTRKADLISKASKASTATPATERVTATTDEPPAKKRRGFFSSLIDNPRIATTSISIESEIQDYLSTACIPEESDPLIFWKVNQKQFPSLAKLVPNYLCIPASSAPVERLFSIAGKIFRPERCRLADKNFQQLMFLRCNGRDY